MQSLKLREDEREHVPLHHVGHDVAAVGHVVVVPHQGGHALVLLLLGVRGLELGTGAVHVVGDGEGAEDELRGEDLERLVGLLAGGLPLGDLAAALLVVDVVELLHGARVKEVVLRHPEDLGDLVVVRHHDLALERLAVRGVRDDRVQLLGALKGELPEVQLRGRVELLDPHVHFEPQAHVAPRRRGQVRVGGVLQVRLEEVLEAAELGLALVPHAEVKRLLGRVGVEVLELRVVLQHLQARPVRLPQEPQPLHVVVPVRASRVA
mmetsp:Transcript_38933/g.90791  ORF Transcript_38933/g.90791 Transcript_38933/m.90791 type:complete len:265 (-) Transcript_38933:548-1342(-)